MAIYQNPTDIANRAIQIVGGVRIADGLLATEDSKNASECRSCYDKLRTKELRRNVWRYAKRKAALRPITSFNGTKLVTFATWLIGTTYTFNDVIVASNGQAYYSLVAGNVGHDPTSTSGFWTNYFGPLTASEFVVAWGAGFTYAIGDHTIGSDGSVYASLVAANINHNPVGDGNVHWSLATTVDSTDTTAATTTQFYAGELVFIGASVYLSLQSGNSTTPPSSKWRTFTAAPALALPNFIYPLGSGPMSDTETNNVFRLPNGFLREAPREGKAGSQSIMGSPTNLPMTDWEYQGNYFTSRESNAIIFSFIADIEDVSQMDPMFCEGLAAVVALAVCEPITQSTAKVQVAAQLLKKVESEAIAVNGIETGPTEPPLDDYIATRA